MDATMESTAIDKDLMTNLNKIKDELGNSIDLSMRIAATGSGLQYALFYIKGFIKDESLASLSLELVQINTLKDHFTEKDGNRFFDKLKDLFFNGRAILEGYDYETLFQQLLKGNIIILIDGCDKFMVSMANDPKGRAIEEPTSQTVIRGPKDGFTENISTNIFLVRKIIKNKSLRIEEMTIGDVTHTTVAVLYMQGIAKEKIIQEIKTRLHKIHIDKILDSGNIEEFISDDPYTIFPTLLTSERPDSVASGLLEGKIAILVDGTPYATLGPSFFAEFFQVSEDYYHNFYISTFTRFVRSVAFILAIFVPSLYIALTTFQQEIIPTPLLISIAAQQQGLPFNAFFEAIIMSAAFEVLQEAGIRMPRAIGPAVSIVGALVLGQAAVEAGFISAAMVIVISITAIANYVTPRYPMANPIRLLRFAFMVVAAIYGLYGIFMGVIVLVVHLSKLKSIGVPYLAPVAPFIKGENKDTVYRAPLWDMKFRPSAISQPDAAVRLETTQPISPTNQGEQELR